MSKSDSTSTEKCCERCGGFDVLEIAEKFLCADCIALAGCGCGGSADGSGTDQ